MRYKVIYHVGDDIDIKTHVESGILTWTDDSLALSGPSSLRIALASLVSVETLQMPGAGTMIKLVSRKQTFFISVVRFSIGGSFALVNLLQTLALFRRLQAQIADAARGIDSVAR